MWNGNEHHAKNWLPKVVKKFLLDMSLFETTSSSGQKKNTLEWRLISKHIEKLLFNGISFSKKL